MGAVQCIINSRSHKRTDFLWHLLWPKSDLTKDVAEFHMTVHAFTAMSSPSCAIFALRKTADDKQAISLAEVIQTVKENFYVDDCLKSMVSEEEAVNGQTSDCALSERRIYFVKMD